MKTTRKAPVEDILVIALVAVATTAVALVQPELGFAMMVGCALVIVCATAFFGLRHLGFLKNF